LDAWTTARALLVAPSGSVTLSRTVYVPRAVNVHVGAASVESSNEPSPSRSQSYESASPSASVEPVPSNSTVSGA
jgi:hypothetical protein